MGQKEDIVKTENKIIVIRDKQVILDRDVAELYGVETKAINQAVKRNIEKFPPEYMFQLSKEEKQEVVTKCDHLLLFFFACLSRSSASQTSLSLCRSRLMRSRWSAICCSSCFILFEFY